MSRCTHRLLILHTEKDRCTWVQCGRCKKVGPKKHSLTKALLAWILCLGDQHPRPKRKARSRKATNG